MSALLGPMHGEAELRAAAAAAKISVHISARLRRECQPAISLYTKTDRARLLATFSSCAAARRFVEGNQDGL